MCTGLQKKYTACPGSEHTKTIKILRTEQKVSLFVKILEIVRKKNRTLLEMYVGMVFIGMVCQIAGALIVKDQLRFAASLWFGILLAAVSAYHLYRTLDRGLDCDEKTATKVMFRGYLIRYTAVALILVLIMVTGTLNPLIVFMGYMSLKVTAFIQPITHKLCNKLFHETDPIPQAMPEEEQTSNE